MEYEKKRDSEEYFNDSCGFIKAHFHQSIEFLYLKSGKCSFTVGNFSGELNSGDLIFVPPLTNHAYDYHEDGVGYCNVLPVEYSEVLTKHVGNRTIENPLIITSAFTKDIYEHLKQITFSTNTILKRGIYEYVLGKIVENVKFVEVKKGGDVDFVRKVLGYIDTHYGDELTLEEVASSLGYSRYYFSVLFNKVFNTNFKTYLNQVRINKSLSLLENNSISVVASLCGYNNLQSFFLNFKRIIGITPKEYVKSLKL
jgi:AraC-like DNA-binding protein